MIILKKTLKEWQMEEKQKDKWKSS